MKRRLKQNPNVSLPDEALKNTFKDLPRAVAEEATDPTFWIAFVLFIGFPTVYYVGTAVLFSIIPKSIWSLFFL